MHIYTHALNMQMLRITGKHVTPEIIKHFDFIATKTGQNHKIMTSINQLHYKNT